MKKIFFFFLLLFTISESKACDICGCGVGGNYIGILPDFNSRILGLRYRYNNLQTHIGTGGTITYLTTKEIFHTTELYGGWNIRKNIRLMATVPYSLTEKTNQGSTQKKSGPGDISLAGFYQLINKRSTAGSSRLLVQSLWLGAGIKLPTGKYNPVDKSNSAASANLFQLGTGSTDFSFHVMYDIRVQDIGMNVNSIYKTNTKNKYQYSYGNKFSISTQLYHKFSMGNKTTIAPNAGIQFESSKVDIDNAITVDASGGNITMGTIGAELSYKKIMFGVNWQTPLSQHLASGIVKANNKAMVHIGFGF